MSKKDVPTEAEMQAERQAKREKNIERLNQIAEEAEGGGALVSISTFQKLVDVVKDIV